MVTGSVWKQEAAVHKQDANVHKPEVAVPKQEVATHLMYSTVVAAVAGVTLWSGLEPAPF